MKCFEVVQKVLEGTYEGVPGDETERDRQVRLALGGLSHQYKTALLTKGGPNFEEPATRFAYVYCYVPAHAHWIYELITWSQPVQAVLANKKVRIACIGGGPGSDLVGVFARNAAPRSKSWREDAVRSLREIRPVPEPVETKPRSKVQAPVVVEEEEPTPGALADWHLLDRVKGLRVVLLGGEPKEERRVALEKAFGAPGVEGISPTGASALALARTFNHHGFLELAVVQVCLACEAVLSKAYREFVLSRGGSAKKLEEFEGRSPLADLLSVHLYSMRDVSQLAQAADMLTALHDARSCRNDIVHGRKVTPEPGMVGKAIEAADKLIEFIYPRPVSRPAAPPHSAHRPLLVTPWVPEAVGVLEEVAGAVTPRLIVVPLEMAGSSCEALI